MEHEKQPKRLSCDVYRDLIPLVNDGVASEDTCQLVEEHLKECEACKAYQHSGFSPEISYEDDMKTIRKVRRSFLLYALGFAVAGSIGTFMLSSSIYILWWMPAVGMATYFIFGKKNMPIAWAAILILLALGRFGNAFLNGWLRPDSIIGYCYETVTNGMMLLIMLALGSLVGALLKFAFGKKKGEQ